MSAADACSLCAGICLPRIPARVLISRDAADMRIPAVSGAHHGLLAMPAGRALFACLIYAGIRRHGTLA